MAAHLKYLNILVYEPEIAIREEMVQTLLSHGYAPKLIEDLRDLKKLIPSRRFQYFLCDITPEDEGLFTILTAIRANPQFRFMNIIIHLREAREETLQSLIKIGCHLMILKPFESSLFADRLNQIIAKQTPQMVDRRRHVRVDVPSYHNGKVILTTPSKRKITTRIKEISAGGMTLMLPENGAYSGFSSEEVIANTLLLLKDLDMFMNLKVVQNTRDQLRVQFHSIEKYKHDLICDYIYQRLVDDDIYSTVEES